MDNYKPEEQNFLLLIQALKYSTVGLKTYVDQCLEDLHDRLKRKVGSNAACVQYRSKRCDVKQWCSTCAAWKQETEKYMRYNIHKNKVQWRDIELWKLSQTDREGAKVELCRIFVRGARFIKYDIQTIMSLLQNCRYFEIGDDKNRLDAVRNVRNIDFAHTDLFEMSKKELSKAISSLLHFFQHPSLKGFQCISTASINIKGLLMKDKHSLTEIEVYTAFRSLRKISEADINDFLSICEDEKKSDGQKISNFSILILFVAILFWTILSNDSAEENSLLVCKNATYDYPFTMDIDLDFYRSQHDKLVGREWLLTELDVNMFFSKRGVLLLAEMGYGKSAIVAHLICQSDKRFPGYEIYQHIVVYHICNFYSRKTLSLGNFVKNLAGGFSKRIPGFLQSLQKNSRFETYFENDGCKKDPEGCLDFLVLKALNGLDMVNNTYIVVIDALDECIEHGKRNIFDLLWKRLTYFPKNIKFFLTSRNTSDIRIARTQLLVLEKRSTDDSNTKDALRFVKSKIHALSLSEQNHLKRIFKTNDDTIAISKAVKYTKGNMLLLRNRLIEWLQNEVSLRDSYTTFEDLFEDQLKRIFRDRSVFKTAIKIFQVLCSTMEPLYIEELLTIADLKDDEIVDVLAIIGKELSHFIRQTNGKISLVHKSLAAYLTDNTRKTEQFYVYKRDGCCLFAKYLLNLLRQRRSFTNISIVDFASYTACSSDKEITNKFLQNSNKHISDFSGVYILHQAAAKLNSYTAMSLLLDLFSLRPVDETDKGNITAAYVAAAFGNHRSLKALLDRHADVNFTRLGPKYINETVDMLHFCKTYAFWEYNLLNIAAQNGHFETVLTLLRYNVNVSHQTSFGSNSFLLAVENGHTHIVQNFLQKFKSIFITSLNQALYLSAKNGYVDIVDLLLNHGAEDFCPLCNSKQYWASFHQTRLQATDSIENLQMINFVFLDDRRFIRCESALEIAVQNGHTDILRLLLKRSNKTLHCRESGGRTPIFTALKFKRSEIFKLLIQQGINILDRCLYRKRRIDVIDFNEKERKEYLENMCPYNTTLSHFLAYYWDNDMYDFGQGQNIWNWTAGDSNGSTPVHYACCAGNRNMIAFLERVGARFDGRSFNGSTPLHSAAICRQNKVLSDLLLRYPESVFDKQNMSISHYAAMSVRFYDQTTEDIIRNDEYSFVNLKHKLLAEIFYKDKYDKSPLHYACENGNVNLFNFYHKFAPNFERVSSDIHDYTILDTAFRSTPILYKSSLITVVHCNIYLFSADVNCDNYRMKIFIPHEYLTFMILKSSNRVPYDILPNVGKYVNISLQKNSAHLLGIIYHNFPYEYSQYMFTNGISSLKNLLKHPEINPLLFTFLPKMRYDCSQITGESIVHDIVQDERKTFWTSLYFDFNQFDILSRSLDTCVDINGYNFLHRSVIGGNYLAFIFLRQLGMSYSTKTRDGKNLIQLFVDNAPCFEVNDKIRNLVLIVFGTDSIVQKPWTENNFASFSYGALASFLATETRLIRQMSLHEICNHATISLSLTHKVASKGLIPLLLEIKKQFGTHALNCVNKNGITTAILLRFFNHLKKYPYHWHLNLKTVSINVIDSLFLKIVLDFKPFLLLKDSLENKCNFIMKNFRNIQRMNFCVLKMEKEFLSTMIRFVKLLGIKSQTDFDAIMSISYIYQNKKLKEFYSDGFVKALTAIGNVIDNHKDPCLGNCFIYQTAIRNAKNKMCLNPSFSVNVNSTECLALIANLMRLKFIYQDMYSNMKSGKMFNFLFLYENRYNIPFENEDQVLINGTLVGHMDIYLSSMLIIYSKNIHVHKKYNFLDWFKSCKNCLAKEMVKKISSSTLREALKWKGSERLFTHFNPSYIPQDTDTPLDSYNLHFEDIQEIKP